MLTELVVERMHHSTQYPHTIAFTMSKRKADEKAEDVEMASHGEEDDDSGSDGEVWPCFFIGSGNFEKSACPP